MKRLTFSIFILITIVVLQFANSQSTPSQMVAKMGRGINLGNVLSAPFEGNWAPPVQETYFDDVATAGFKNVRIPIRFDMHTTPLSDVTYLDASNNYIGSPSDYNVTPAFLDRVEEVTDWALNKGLVTIIDVHGDKWYWESYDSGSTEYKTGNDLLAAEDRFRAIWRDISTRFQNKSENLLFEIMNEAYFSMTAEEVNAVNADILSIIRQTNATRNVIVTGGGINSWQAPLQLPASFLTSDSYLIPTFHYYLPRAFTASGTQNHNDYDWGTAQDKADVDNHFDQVKSWADTNNVPVFLGEFGADNVCGYDYITNVCGDFGGPDEASRVAYHEYIAEAAISRGFSFAAWDAGEKSNKTVYKVTDRTWVEDVKNALLGSGALGLKNISIEKELEVYPNPANDYLTIKSEKEIDTIEMYNIQGQLFETIEDLEIINVSQLTNGLYILKANFSDGQSLNRKILIN